MTDDGEQPTGPATLYDVARRAGVSQPTASRVLNGSTRKVGGPYRERVLQAARELGYLPNVSAQAFANGTSRTVGLIVGSIMGAYFSALSAELMRCARSTGYRLSINISGRIPERELDIVRSLREMRPAAIVFAGTGLRDHADHRPMIEELTRFEARGGRVILVSRTGLPFTSVNIDDRIGAERLGRALGELGYREALTLGSSAPLSAMQERVVGFAAGLGVHGGRVESRDTDLTWEEAYAVVSGLSEQLVRRIDLIFAVTDEVALGARAALRDRGLQVPTDVAVAGFNDMRTSRDVAPPLTTVHVPLDTLAEETMRLVTAPTGATLASRIISTYPVLRASTPPRSVTSV